MSLNRKCLNWPPREIKKNKTWRNKSNPLSCMITNGSKNQKKFLMYFDPVARVSDLSDGLKIHLCDDFSSVDYISLIRFFSRIAWIDKLHDLVKEFFPNKGCHGNRKNIFFSFIIATIAKSKNASSKTWILWRHTITEKNELIG